jgi:uncharacterized protein YidB (DUF937 family)
MGFLDGLMQQIGGGASTTGGGGLGDIVSMVTSNPQILSALKGLLSSRDESVGGSAGLAGLVDTFQQKGLGDMMSGWISNGPNPGISPSQITDVLGTKTMAQFANRAGVPEAQAGSLLAGLLPAAINHLTPNGKIPETNDLENSLSSLLGKLGA